MKKLFTSVSLCLLALFSQGQTILEPGDLFFTAFQYGVTPARPDRFAFVLLKNVEPGTKILFTDKALLAGNPQSLCTGEDTCLWTSPNVVVNAGTVVTIIEEGDVDNAIANLGTCEGGLAGLSSSGDQIIALQRTAGGTLNFISAISNAGFLAICASQCNNNNTTCLPAQLIDTQFFMSFSISPAIINGFYNGPTSFDSISAFYAAVRNQNNWTTSRQSDSAASWPSPWSFSITTVSVKEKMGQNKLRVYPNPSLGAVNISSQQGKTGKIRVVNILGVLIEEKSIQSESITFQNLKPGLYMVQWMNEKNQPGSAVKLVVK